MENLNYSFLLNAEMLGSILTLTCGCCVGTTTMATTSHAKTSNK